jgi:hypothetical protein
MEPNKFEKHIKKQLEEREIQPSVNAWESLSEKLDAVGAPQLKRKGYFWYGIAASVIGLLIISVLYFNTSNSKNTSEVQIVDATDEPIESRTSSGVIEEEGVKAAIVEYKSIKELPPEDIKSIDKNPISELNNQVASVEKNDTALESVVEKVETPYSFKEEIINTKVFEIVAAVDSLEQNNNALTNAEVDSLLRNAQEEILREKLFNKTGSVDAMALLTEVEDELDESFRDQIFESLKTGFLKVRTAVADRNK